MAAKIIVDEMEISIETDELAIALSQIARYRAERSAASAPVRERHRVIVNNVEAEPAPTARDKVAAAKMLRLIADYTVSGGVTADQLMPVLETNHPKGVGSRVASINRVLRETGFEIDDIYTNSEREGSGARQWRAGPKLQEALEMLELV